MEWNIERCHKMVQNVECTVLHVAKRRIEEASERASRRSEVSLSER